MDRVPRVAFFLVRPGHPEPRLRVPDQPEHQGGRPALDPAEFQCITGESVNQFWPDYQTLIRD